MLDRKEIGGDPGDRIARREGTGVFRRTNWMERSIEHACSMIDMKIAKTVEGTRLLIALEGRLDTTTAPQLETELKASLDGITLLEFDFAALEYLSSAGLRVILTAQKIMNKQGKMVIRHVNETIMEVFEITGFVDILTIEDS